MLKFIEYRKAIVIFDYFKVIVFRRAMSNYELAILDKK